MQQWTPEEIFILTYIGAALSGLADLLKSDRPLTMRNILASILFFGAVGSALGMLAFTYLGGRESPWKIVACGMLVGVKVIKFSDITFLVRKILDIPHDDNKK